MSPFVGAKHQRDKAISRGNTLAYRVWTTEEDAELLKYEKEGHSIYALSKAFKRSEKSIKTRLHKLKERN